MIMSNLFASLFVQGAYESRTDAGVVVESNVGKTVAAVEPDSKSENEEQQGATEPMAK